MMLVILTLTAATVHRNSVWLNRVKLWSDVVIKSPLKPRPHILLGSALSIEKKWDEASIQFKIAKNLTNSKEVKAHADVGLSNLDQTSILNFRIAEERESVEQNPNAEGFARLGFLYMEAKELYLAAKEFERAIELSPSYTEPYGGLATIYIDQGMKEKAITVYQEAIKHNPNEERAYIGLGVLYMETNRTDDAIAQFAKALSINPQSYMANYNLGLAYGIKGWPEKARKHYRIAQSLK